MQLTNVLSITINLLTINDYVSLEDRRKPLTLYSMKFSGCHSQLLPHFCRLYRALFTLFLNAFIDNSDDNGCESSGSIFNRGPLKNTELRQLL